MARWRSRKRWRIAGGIALAATLVGAGVIAGDQLGTHTTPPTPGGRPPAALPTATAAVPPVAQGIVDLAADFAQLATKLNAVAGIAISAVGSGQNPIPLGDWQSGPAWSTIKVPLIIAALREEKPPTITAAMKAAITESDNAAAESIWADLGTPVTAAHKVEAVLRQNGDPTTTVQSQKVRPEFTAFGQTDWPLIDQVRFTAAAVCDPANAPVFDLMGQVEPQQSWGIGTIPGTRFKGGWGPSPTGDYLVRQIGVLTTEHGMIAVALAAEPVSGKFDDGTADLSAMASWLSGHVAGLPVGHCGP